MRFCKKLIRNPVTRSWCIVMKFCMEFCDSEMMKPLKETFSIWGSLYFPRSASLWQKYWIHCPEILYKYKWCQMMNANDLVVPNYPGKHLNKLVNWHSLLVHGSQMCSNTFPLCGFEWNGSTNVADRTSQNLVERLMETTSHDEL